MNKMVQKTTNQLELLKLMYLSREGDRREGILHRQSKGWFQVAGMGHEALAAASILLRDGDYFFPYYRDRAMVLARGVSNAELASAYFAKRGSSSGGRQMPAHYSDRARNIWSVSTPTGANMLPACGAAWSMQLKGLPNVALATIGDAASRQGEFFEAVSFAVERKLPVVFIVEDNQYGISTNTEQFNPFKLGVFSQDIPVHAIDARHPDRVATAASQALDHARRGDGPTVLWCQLDRLCSHTCSDDQRVYRPQDEIDAMAARDPITVVADELISRGQLARQEWADIQREIEEQVFREYEAAAREEDPLAEELMGELLGPEPQVGPPPLAGGKKWRMVDAINSVFKHALATDDEYVFFGEDIEDPKGGVFRLTKDLSTAHPDRVFNSPLAEATIMGVGCGMASFGMKPVFELQFVDFVGPGWNQISQNMTTLRWRSFGEWKCPMIIYAPYGAYLPGSSIWHSQSNESLFAHLPGLRVVVPSTPEDAAGLMWTALHAEDPTIFLIPKHLFRLQMEVSEEVPAVGYGSARVRHSGNDVTVVAWGNCIEFALAAASELADEASVEVIDLRSIVPWDRDTVIASLEKTGRLVVVQEDGVSSSVGQMIVSEMVGDPDTWSLFYSAPQLVAKPDVHIGFNPIYENAALPVTQDIVDAIRLTLED
jgi:2-oxoisovalerate dehydrogenase E1 component